MAKKGIDKKYYYAVLILLLIGVVLYFNYSDKNLKNNLNGICNDPEGKVNDFYSRSMVQSGSDETGRVGFTDICLKDLEKNLDSINLQIYLNKIYNFGGIKSSDKLDENVLLEGYCPESIPNEFSEVNPMMMISYYRCPNGCSEGACIS